MTPPPAVHLGALRPALQWLAGWWQVIHLGAVMGVLALSASGRRQAWGSGLAGQVYRASGPMLAGFTIATAVLSLVVIRIVIVTAQSYGLSQYALEMVVRVLVLELIPLAAQRIVDNGPGWCAVMLRSAAQVRAVKPDWSRLGSIKLGLVGAHQGGHDTGFELRALIGGGNYEDPVTGSLNASVAQWLIGAGLAPEAYVAGQGHALQRDGRVHIRRDGDTIWVGGDVVPLVAGEVDL